MRQRWRDGDDGAHRLRGAQRDLERDTAAEGEAEHHRRLRQRARQLDHRRREHRRRQRLCPRRAAAEARQIDGDGLQTAPCQGATHRVESGRLEPERVQRNHRRAGPPAALMQPRRVRHGRSHRSSDAARPGTRCARRRIVGVQITGSATMIRDPPSTTCGLLVIIGISGGFRVPC
ncbi:MAG: hypothetical protein ABI831_25260 [Betaproteobacteria bacterium]